MPRFKTLFFDFGDTLAPISPVPLPDRMRHVFAELDLAAKTPARLPENDEALVERHTRCSEQAGWPLEQGWAAEYVTYYRAWAEAVLLACGASEAQAASHAQAFAEGFRDHSDSVRIVFDDCIPVLERLRAAGYRMAIVSNNDGTLLRRTKYLKIDGYFDVILDSAHVESNKPDAGIFNRALADMKAAPEDVLHVGDLFEADVEGAGALGIACAWINHKRVPAPESKYSAAYDVANLTELAAHLT